MFRTTAVFLAFLIAHSASAAPPITHLVFSPATVPDVVQGDQLGISVEIQDTANTVVTGDNTTQVTLTLTLPVCGATVTFGPVTVAAGVADFTGVGQRFYTLASNLQLRATDDRVPASLPVVSNTFNVVADPVNNIFADGFESCTL